MKISHLILDVVVFIVVVGTIFFVYKNYGDEIKEIFFTDHSTYTIFLGDVSIDVTVAADDASRKRGLSGTPALGDYEGKLFIFDDSQKYGIWMKDMLFPIDIIWFNDKLEVIHYEENVHPNTYPEVFAPDEPARFVLEMNAYFVKSLKIKEGDRFILPSKILPEDIRKNLHN